MESNQRTAPNFLDKRQAQDKHFDKQFEDYLILMENWETLFAPYVSIYKIRAVFDYWYNHNILFVESSNTIKI